MSDEALFEQALLEAKAARSLRELMNGTMKLLPDSYSLGQQGLVNIEQTKITPMLGVKSVQVTAIARSEDSQDAYKVAIAFYDVEAGNKAKLDASPCRVTCGCRSHYFWFAYPNYLADAHLGPKPKEYVPVANPKRTMPPKNPDNVPGVCKHLVALGLALQQNGVIE